MTERMPQIDGGANKPAKVPYRKFSKFCNHNAPGTPAHLTSARKLSVEQIKRREEIRNTKHRLRSILIQKLTAKFKGRVPKKKIVEYVDAFVSSKLKVTTDDLMNLERDIQSSLGQTGANGKWNEGQNGMKSENNGGSSENNANATGTNNQPESRGANGASNDLTLPKGHEWEALMTYQSVIGEDKDKEEFLREKQKKIELRKSLDKQVEEAKRLKKKEYDADREYYQNITKDVEAFNDENKEKYHQLVAHHELERKKFDDLMKEERERKEADRLAKLEAEERDLARIRDAINKEKKYRQDKKEEEHRIHQMILLENEENDRRRAKQKLKEIEENGIIMKAYAAKLDAEERAREAAFKKRMDKLEQFTKWADEEGPGAKQREEERKFEEMLLNEQLKKEERDRQAEVDKAQARQNRLKMIAVENTRQIQQKEDERNRERAADVQYASEKMADVELYKKERKDERLRDKEMKNRYGQSLNDQMIHRKNHIDNMNDDERHLNKDALNTITHDPHFQSRVFHRLRIGGSKDGSRPSTCASFGPNGRNRPTSFV